MDDTDDTGWIGQQIRETIDSLREEAREATGRADAIARAWETWDVDGLERLDAISPPMAAYLRAERERAS